MTNSCQAHVHTDTGCGHLPLQPSSPLQLLLGTYPSTATQQSLRLPRLLLLFTHHLFAAYQVHTVACETTNSPLPLPPLLPVLLPMNAASAASAAAGSPLISHPAMHSTPPRVHPQDVLEAKVLTQRSVKHLQPGRHAARAARRDKTLGQLLSTLLLAGTMTHSLPLPCFAASYKCPSHLYARISHRCGCVLLSYY
jgi:hypothetical protein